MRLAAVATTTTTTRAMMSLGRATSSTTMTRGRWRTSHPADAENRTTRRQCARGITIATHATTTRRDDDDDGRGGRKQMKMTETLRVKKLSETATLPVRGSDGAAGYDLARYEDDGDETILRGGVARGRRRRRRRTNERTNARAGDRRASLNF